MKILVVEDNADKLRTISRAICEVEGISADDIAHACDLRSARQRLKTEIFSLMILDVALPPRIDQEVKRDAGLDLLTEIEEGRLSTPAYVVGITGHEDVFSDFCDRFSDRMLALLHYDPSGDAWVRKLQGHVRHMVAVEKELAGTNRKYGAHAAIVCALELELDAILRLPWGWEQTHIQGDNAIYHRGFFDRESERRVVYASTPARKGMPSSAVLASKMASAFSPRYLCMSGIAAGVKGKVGLGDVVVADQCWDYGSGKWIVERDTRHFQPAPNQLSVDESVRKTCRELVGQRALVDAIRHAWPNPPEQSLRIHIGPMASGAAVISDGYSLDQVRQQHRELLALEMEAYGVFIAARDAVAPRPQALVVKSIVDYADGEKDDTFQRYAAYTSAQFLKLICERVE